MHIYSITMKNFKSYRDFILMEYLDPSVNLIIGENGNGKSNFMDAIMFVLTDKYSNIRHEDKKQLVHEEIGEEIKEIFVELIIDNKERKIPIDKDLIKLKKVYHVQENFESVFINDKKFPKNEFDNILETGGFTLQNPFFIIQQGKINNFINMTDAELFSVFSELTGMKVYEEKKQESENFLKDATLDIQRIKTKKEEIESFIEKLNIQKNELDSFKELDINKKVLNEIIFSENLIEIQKYCDILQEDKNRISEIFQKKLRNLQQKKLESTIIFKEIQEDETLLKKIKNKIFKCEDEISELKIYKTKELSAFEILKENQLENISKKELTKVNSKEEMEYFENKNKIKIIENEIAEIQKNITTNDLEYKKLLTNIEMLNLNTHDKFENKNDEKTFIQNEIKNLTDQINSLSEEIQEIDIKIKNIQINHKNSSEKLSDIMREKKNFDATLNKINFEISNKQKFRIENINYMKLKDIDINELRENISSIEEEIKYISKSIPNYEILRTVKEIEKEIIYKNHENKSSDKIVGILIDLIDVDEKFYDAIDIIAKDKLYSIIVKNFDVADEIVKLNSEKKGPVISILPLDWTNNSEIIKEKNPYLENKDFVPLINFIKVKKEIKSNLDNFSLINLENIIYKIFGKTMLVKNYETGLKISKEQKVNCITKENEVIYSGAYLTKIGNYDTEKKRIFNFLKIKNYLLQKDNFEKRVSDYNFEKVSKINQENQIIRDIQSLQNEKKEISNQLEMLLKKEKKEEEDVKNSIDLLTNLEILKEKKRIILDENDNKLIKYSELLKNSYDFEGYEKTNNNTIDEQQIIETKKLMMNIEKSLIEFEKKIKILNDKKLEIEKNIIYFENSNLKNKKDYIPSSKEIENLFDFEDKECIEAQISSADFEIKKYNDLKEKLKLDLYSTEEKYQNNNNKLILIQKEIKSNNEEITLLETKLKNTILMFEENSDKKQHLIKKIANLGKIDQKKKNEFLSFLGIKSNKTKNFQMDICTSDDDNDYDIDKKIKKIEKKLQPIFKKLAESNKKLEKFKKINKFVEEDLENFIKKNEEISKKLNELKIRQDEIQFVINSLDKKQENSIYNTFKKVKLKFKENFSFLIPNGYGDLELYEENFIEKNIKNKKKMISITANFDGNNNAIKKMNQLSGGQKTIVVISLIFALSQVDKPPFYILDEIDSALDFQIRKNFTLLIKEFSKKTQFLISTFKNEILEITDHIYKVKFSNKTSFLNKIEKSDAENFLNEINQK